MEKTLKEMTDGIQALFAEFTENANKQLNGNKAAGQRARKKSLDIEKVLKEFRKVSLEKSKENE